jgi:nifR3 family TIM-barrel protein
MAGITNAAFRTLCRRYGGGLYVSEMVNARGLVERSDRSWRMVAREPDAGRHSVQLYGSDPSTVGEAVRLVIGELGVDHVDLNFGCPAPKVTRKGGGAALPVRRVLFAHIVGAAVAAAEAESGGAVPVTVKMRIGLDDGHRTALEAGRSAQDAGVAAVALHARTAEQLYSGRADWTAIAALVDALDVPVLGNGDIWTPADALAMRGATGCAGVVVGRGCLGRPWLFRDLADAFAGRPVTGPPPLGEVVAVMGEHLRLLVALLGPLDGVRSFRRHVAWYLIGLPVGRELRARLVTDDDPAGVAATLDEVLGRTDPDLRPPPELAHAPRGHTAGPRRPVVPDGWFDDLDDPTPPRGADLAVSGG